MKIRNLNSSFLLMLLSVFVAWWFVAYKIEPFLHYHCQQTGFSGGARFFKEIISSPGGFSNYLSDFTVQFFSLNLIGSLVIVAVASVQALIALNIITRLTGISRFRFTVFALILLTGILVITDYHYPYHASIRILFLFLITWFFTLLYLKFKTKSLYLWPLFAILLFYIASGATLIVFALTTVIILIFTSPKKTWLPLSPFVIIFAGVLPYLGYRFVFPSDLTNLYQLAELKHPEMLEYKVNYMLYFYYLILPFILILTILIFKMFPENQADRPHLKVKKPVKFSIFKQGPFIVLFQLVCFVALGWFIYSKSFDPLKKKILYIGYYAEKEEWKKLLEVAETIEVYDFRVNFYVVRAYANLGMLPDKLFYYPQLLGPKAVIFDTSTINGSLTMPTSDLYFDLGFMSEAQHWAFEAQTLMPYSPRVLKRLVMINLVNRKYELAGKFLKVLGTNWLYNDWVKKYENYVADTTLASNDKMIAEKRRFTPTKRAINNNPLENMKLLVETNTENRMAYDYLLALCILDTNYPEFINYVQHYRSYNINTLPGSWAEMLLVYILKNKAIPPFLSDESISEENSQRFKTFNDLMLKYNNNKDAAQRAVKQQFENTYWYYLLYLNPKVAHAYDNKTLNR